MADNYDDCNFLDGINSYTHLSLTSIDIDEGTSNKAKGFDQ
jgi:hypothetical protein